MRPRSVIWAAILLLAVAVSGCGAVTDHNAKITLQQSPPVHIAVIPKSVGLDYWSKVHAGAECAVSRLRGVKVTWNGRAHRPGRRQGRAGRRRRHRRPGQPAARRPRPPVPTQALWSI